MIRYSSSVHKSDWECSSKSVRGSFFVNPLYIKNLTNLTNLTTLQTLQPYRQCVDTFLFCAACTGGEAFFRATCTGFKLEKWHFPTTEWLVPLGPGANQRYGMETVWTVKNKKDPPKQVLFGCRVAAARHHSLLPAARHHSLLPRMLMTFRRCCIAAAMDSTASSNCRMVGIDWPARAPSLFRSRSIR